MEFVSACFICIFSTFTNISSIFSKPSGSVKEKPLSCVALTTIQHEEIAMNTKKLITTALLLALSAAPFGKSR
jgi:hypothetical protein